MSAGDDNVVNRETGDRPALAVGGHAQDHSVFNDIIAGGELGERGKIIRLKLGKKAEPAGINAQNRFVTAHRDCGLVKDGSVSADGNDKVTAGKKVAGFTGQNSINA